MIHQESLELRPVNPHVKYDLDQPAKHSDVFKTYLPTRNTRTPARILEEDRSSGKVTDSLQYYNGTKYVPGKWRLFSLSNVSPRIDTLMRFYPNESIITNTARVYKGYKDSAYSYALGFTALSWYFEAHSGSPSSSSLAEV